MCDVVKTLYCFIWYALFLYWLFSLFIYSLRVHCKVKVLSDTLFIFMLPESSPLCPYVLIIVLMELSLRGTETNFHNNHFFPTLLQTVCVSLLLSITLFVSGKISNTYDPNLKKIDILHPYRSDMCILVKSFWSDAFSGSLLPFEYEYVVVKWLPR